MLIINFKEVMKMFQKVWKSHYNKISVYYLTPSEYTIYDIRVLYVHMQANLHTCEFQGWKRDSKEKHEECGADNQQITLIFMDKKIVMIT